MSKPQTKLDEVEQIFLAAMRVGWAAGNNGEPIPSLPNWKQCVYSGALDFEGQYSLTDRWGIDPDSGKSSGSIVITAFGIPVWVMWLGGDPYPKQAIPFLKESLMQNYEAREFFGGRGPHQYMRRNLAYSNAFFGSFSHFWGIEFIQETHKILPLGTYTYWGGSLMYLDKT